MHAFFATIATFAPTLLVIGLTLPFLMPRRFAALGIMLIGAAVAVFPPAISTWAMIYGGAWVVLGIATHALRRRAAKPEETTCRAAVTGA